MFSEKSGHVHLQFELTGMDASEHIKRIQLTSKLLVLTASNNSIYPNKFEQHSRTVFVNGVDLKIVVKRTQL